MITKMTGTLNRVLDEEVRVQVGPIEYGLSVSESVRRVVQMRVNQEITFHVFQYFEGNNTGSRFIPRLIGFLTEAELEFFDLFCTVDKIGAKKALKAMARPVKEIADAILRQDSRWLSTLPGIGAATAEQIVTTLKKKVTAYTVVKSPEVPPAADAPTEKKAKGSAKKGAEPEPTANVTPADGALIEDVYQALMGLGHSPIEARSRLDGLLTCGKPFGSLQDALALIYSQKG
jgi:Holliday junction DNA helicase RuvA